MLWLPAFVDPKPVRGVPADNFLEFDIDVARDIFDGPGFSVVAQRYFRSGFDAPFCKTDAIAEGGEQPTIVAQREDGRSRTGGAFPAEERNPNSAAAGMLIHEQSQENSGLAHGGFECCGFGSALE